MTDDEAVRTAAELLAKAAAKRPVDGRPLFAANLALPWPDEPVAKLWHATTLLREQRGDGHVARARRQRGQRARQQRAARGGGPGAEGLHHAQQAIRRRRMARVLGAARRP